MAILRQAKGYFYLQESYRQDGKVRTRNLVRYGKTNPRLDLPDEWSDREVAEYLLREVRPAEPLPGKRLRPLAYYGGKYKLAPKIVRIMPEHQVYCEPFCGGASVLLAKPYAHQVAGYREVLNDSNGAIATMLRVAKYRPRELQDSLAVTLYSKAAYDDAIAVFGNPENHSELEVAWATVVAIEFSSNGAIGRGWAKTKRGSNHARSFAKKIDEILPTFERLKLAYVENRDAIACIEKWDSPETFFYLDPPYVADEKRGQSSVDQGHYGGYGTDDFRKLVVLLEQIEGRFILSSYQVDSLVPGEWRKIEIPASASTARFHGKTTEDARTECLYLNFDPDEMVPFAV